MAYAPFKLSLCRVDADPAFRRQRGFCLLEPGRSRDVSFHGVFCHKMPCVPLAGTLVTPAVSLTMDEFFHFSEKGLADHAF
jgi:hypothetical protein